MRRVAAKIPIPAEAKQITDYLADMEGTCVCGAIMRVRSPRMMLTTTLFSVGQQITAAYCLNCANRINNTLKMLAHTMHTGTETAPIERLK